MKWIALLLALCMPLGQAQAEGFELFQACIGPELEDRARYRALYICGQQDDCVAADFLADNAVSFRQTTRLRCGTEQIERCIGGDRTADCLQDFTDVLLSFRSDVVAELTANRLQTVAEGLEGFRKDRFLQQSVGLGQDLGTWSDDLGCPAPDLLVEDGLSIPDNLFCHASRALTFWHAAEILRDDVEQAEAEAR